MAEIGLALIGCGRWGANLARVGSRADGMRLRVVADSDGAAATELAGRLRGGCEWASTREVLADPTVQAVMVATPASTHFLLAEAALTAGKHLLVEKPLAFNRRECQHLGRLAAANGLTLMVGHTFHYSRRLERLVKWIAEGAIGRVEYIHSERLAYGVFRDDVDVLWNLGPHDVSIINWLAGTQPSQVTAEAVTCGRPMADAATVSLDYPDFTAQIRLSAVHPIKTRRLTVVGSRGIAVWDDVSGSIEIARRDGSCLGGTVRRQIAQPEPLLAEVTHFAHCIAAGRAPLTGWQAAADVADVLQAATAASARGRRVRVGHPVAVTLAGV